MKRVIIGIITVIFSFLIFSPNVMALDCNTGTCYCTADGTDCALLRNPRGKYTTQADMTECGCPATVLPANDDMKFCLRTSAIWQFIGYGLFALKIIIPLIIIAFGIIDFSKAVLSSDDKAIKSAAMSLVKRLIAGVAIFFIPTVVTVVFNFLEDFTGGLAGIEECRTCLLTPNSETCDDYIDRAESMRKSGN